MSCRHGRDQTPEVGITGHDNERGDSVLVEVPAHTGGHAHIKLSVGSIMSGLSSSVVQKLVFPIPSLDEQKKIAEFLIEFDETITLHQRKSEQEKQKKKALMQLLLTGKVRCI